MKRFLLLFALICSLLITSAYASGGDKDKAGDIGNELQRKSVIGEPPTFGPVPSSFPQPFAEIGNPFYRLPISTGYYFVDNLDEAPDYWRPVSTIVDTTMDRERWTKILSGPRQVPINYWNENEKRFFRNPALPLPNGDYFSGPTDSTDDAIAGPMSIGFGFYFNGIRYDSFYVSTNGLIALTNRRYFYDESGNRRISSNGTCYDPMSMDWFAPGRSRVGGTGEADALEDDFGYHFAVLGNTSNDHSFAGSQTANTEGGIRIRGTGRHLNSFNANLKQALIAPFWGDMHLSQFYSEMNIVDDHGQVWYRKSADHDTLIIYFMNIAPVRSLATPRGTYTGSFDLRPGPQYVSANGQVVLNRLDSSITIIFENFNGLATVGGRPVDAKTIFRYNTTCGVRGFARHVNYGQSGGPQDPWATYNTPEYEQYTNYFSKYQNPNVTFPDNSTAVKFKQWQNTLRVVDIQYRVRKLDEDADLEFTETVTSSAANDYELLAGEERIGAIQPVAIIQNLTNELQGPEKGVNFVKQELNFRARFRIVNEATSRIIYNRLVPIDSTCLALDFDKDPPDNPSDCNDNPYVKVRYSSVSKSGANYTATDKAFPGTSQLNGIPPYEFVQIYFPPFEPNEFLENHIGRLRAFIIADPTDVVTNEPLGDEWPFDDTASVRIFVMRRFTEESAIQFEDDVTEFHIVSNVTMPSVLKWVNIDAEVVSGDQVSNHPLPPRGQYPAANNENYPLESPVIRMDRVTLQQAEPASSPGGDQIRSFPIDMRGKHGAVLSLAVQRSERRDDWERGWSDQTLIAPEPRAVLNQNPLSPWTPARSASATPDELVVEIAQPSPDRLNYICNIPEKRWRNHPRRDGAAPITNMAAYTLYGAGGAMRGFLEEDKDSSLALPSGGYYNGLRPDLFDDGIDFEYKKIFVAIPDTFINGENEGAKNFRFRIAVRATNDQKCPQCIPDDKDPFFVDNIRLMVPSEITDIEITSVRPLWPYTVAPASQAIKIPIRAKVSNNTSVDAPTFLVKVKIFRRGDTQPIYCRIEQLPFLTPGTEVEVMMPNWNAREAGPGTYRLVANVIVPGEDLEPMNDTTETEFQLEFGDVFAYDPARSPQSNVEDNQFTGLPGRGLNMYGFAYGGMGNQNGPSGGYDEINYGAGYVGGSGSGQIAVKFQLYQADTVYGYQAFYTTMNQALDDISLAFYTDQNQPSQIVPGTLMYRQRGLGDTEDDPLWDEYVTYLLDKPVVLPAGKYWAAIGQLGETGLELGASKSRVGMRITSVYVPPPTYLTQAVGGAGLHLCIEKQFRQLNNTGSYVNNNLFAFENTRGSGTWPQFMPTSGNPAYAHLHHFGTSPSDGQTLTLSRGTWIPMIRPYLGERAYSTNPEYKPCPDDIPVELTTFDGEVRETGIQLFWETVSEVNNYGFHVERRFASEGEEWNQVGFVKGAGNTNSVTRYDYFDKDVELNSTYQYRLRQVDNDGNNSCESLSEVITVRFVSAGSLVLEQNTPNPFSAVTKIAFVLPYKANAKLEVMDIYGNVVKTLVDAELGASAHEFSWDGTNEFGTNVANGTYIYRLTSGDEVRTAKMTLIR